jgi:hypothetical protein
MAALPVNRYAPARPREGFGWVQALRDLLTARPRLAYAYVFAAGLVVGLTLFGVVGDVLPGMENDVYGTLVSKDAMLHPAAVDIIDLDEAEGRVQVGAGNGQVVVELALDARQPLEVDLTFDASKLRLRGFTRQDDGSEAVMVTETGRVRLTVQGRHAYLLTFDDHTRRDVPLQVRLSRNGEIRYEKTLHTQTP